MKIAQIAPLVESVPPYKYGGTERVVYALTEELVKLGHEVTLFASGDSQTSAKLVAGYHTSLRKSGLKKIYGTNTWSILHIAKAFLQHDKFDIIHDHSGQDRGGHLGYVIANFVNTPTVVTMHNPITRTKKPLFAQLNKPYIVTLSKPQMPKSLRKISNYLGVVHNGLYMEDYPFSQTSDGYLLFIGRMSRKKGLYFAIQAAQKLKMPLLIGAKLDPSFKDDVKYFETFVKPNLNNEIKWLNEIDQEKRNKLMSKALCLLHPAIWKEPFGLDLIEANACGTPVVAFNRGSIPEIIVDGKTGFVVDNVNHMIDAIKKVGRLDRNKIRQHSLENFNANVMTENYLKVYKRAIDDFQDK